MPEIAALTSIESVPIASITPYWRNPRKNDAAVPGVKASIEAFGINQPIVVDKKGVIIVGHTRYRAMMELGLKHVPIVRATHLKAKDAKAYRIADNKTGESAEWDQQALIPELRGTDLATMGLFFKDGDLAKMLGDANGVNFKPVSTEDMDKVLNHNQSSGPGTRIAGEGQIRIECPHCSEGFWMERSIIATGAGEKE